MKVLTIVEDLGMGGTQRAAANYAKEYARRGFESAVLGAGASAALADSVRAAGAVVHPGAGSLARSVQTIRGWQPDVIHIHAGGQLTPLYQWILQQLKQPGTKVIKTNVFGRPDYGPGTRALVDLELHISNWSRLKWACWTRASRRPPDIVFPYLVDTYEYTLPTSADRESARTVLSIDPSARVLGRIGQASPAKWNPILLNVFEEIARADDRVVLVMMEPPDEIKQAVARLPAGLRERVHVHQATPDVATIRTLYAAMDVFVHAARIGESFGMVLVESALQGVPVSTLATPVKDNAQVEVVRTLGHGWVARDVTTLASNTMESLRAAQDGTDASAPLAARAREAFGLRENGDRLAELINAVTDEPDASAAAKRLQERWRDWPFGGRAAVYEAVRAEQKQMKFADRLVFALVHQPVVYRAYFERRTRAQRAVEQEKVNALNRGGV